MRMYSYLWSVRAFAPQASSPKNVGEAGAPMGRRFLGTAGQIGDVGHRAIGTSGDVRPLEDKEVDQVKTLVDRISPLLHGQDRQVQGAVLADLLARWLAGHCVPDDRFQTILMRGRILQQHMKIVRDLVKVNAMQMELENID